MGRHGRLDAFAEAELIIRIIQPDRTAADRVHRRQDLFSGRNVSVVDPLSALQTSIWPKNGNDQGRKPPDQGVIFIAVIGAPSMAANYRRSDREPAPSQIISGHIRVVRLAEQPPDRSVPSHSVFRRRVWGGPLASVAISADDLVDCAARRGMVPSLQFPDQHQPRTRPALVAVVGTGSITIVEPEPIFAAANRARTVLVAQKTGIYTKLRQDLLPTSAGALDRVHGRRGPRDLAKAICCAHTQLRIAVSGASGSTNRELGQTPNFFRHLQAAQPG